MLSTHIKSVILPIALIGFSATKTHAQQLTSQERIVCSSLRACTDILSRHDATEFDYSVLGAEFRRFGLAGKSALFTILESENGQADIARLISTLGPLSTKERERIQTGWSKETSASYLPLFMDGHAQSRDFLLRTLGHPDADVREQARNALIRLPETVQGAPIPGTVQADLLSALQLDPIAQAAPYLARSKAAGHEAKFVALLGSGNTDIVTAAYNALYQNNPAQAFNGLLAEMNRMESAVQSRAVGDMLAARHSSRPDGFYQKFARDMSGDEKLSVAARASGLHSLLMIADGPFPDLTPARSEALSFLLKGQPLIAQDQYLPYLKSAGAEAALALTWKIAQDEKWMNRDQISTFYTGKTNFDRVTADLLKSNDLRNFSAGLARVKPAQIDLVRAQIDHPITAIAGAARQKLRLSPRQKLDLKCPIKPFDLTDMRAQMPFFDSGWMVAENGARTSLPRAYLTSAHPTARGWLAGYDLTKSGARNAFSGGAILHYDNATGAFEQLGDFEGPIAILPARPLRLGQTTEQFWVLDRAVKADSRVSAYAMDISGNRPRIRHIDSLPENANAFSTTANGDLIVTFNYEGQSPIRLSKSGQMSLACASPIQANASRAPQ